MRLCARCGALPKLYAVLPIEIVPPSGELKRASANVRLPARDRAVRRPEAVSRLASHRASLHTVDTVVALRAPLARAAVAGVGFEFRF